MKALLFLFIAILSVDLSQQSYAETNAKNRVIILSDIEAYPDGVAPMPE